MAIPLAASAAQTAVQPGSRKLPHHNRCVFFDELRRRLQSECHGQGGGGGDWICGFFVGLLGLDLLEWLPSRDECRGKRHIRFYGSFQGEAMKSGKMVATFDEAFDHHHQPKQSSRTGTDSSQFAWEPTIVCRLGADCHRWCLNGRKHVRCGGFFGAFPSGLCRDRA